MRKRNRESQLTFLTKNENKMNDEAFNKRLSMIIINWNSIPIEAASRSAAAAVAVVPGAFKIPFLFVSFLSTLSLLVRRIAPTFRFRFCLSLDWHFWRQRHKCILYRNDLQAPAAIAIVIPRSSITPSLLSILSLFLLVGRLGGSGNELFRSKNGIH